MRLRQFRVKKPCELVFLPEVYPDNIGREVRWGLYLASDRIKITPFDFAV
jgi:hypothetical protein